jgi:hypothetical protein
MIRTIRRFWNQVLGSLRLRNSDDALAEELESHVQMLAEEQIRTGLPPERHRQPGSGLKR